MAKDTKAVQVADQGNSALARPSFIPKGDVSGTEHIVKDDMQIPRISIAQGLSPELLEGDPKHVPDLRVGDAFNDLTKQVYGRGPLEVVIIRADPPRGIEFIPREEGGGIRDLNVPLDDPRMQFGPNGEKPVATKFYDYILLTLPINPESPMESMVALSLKSSGLKVARQLNSLIKMRSTPLYAMRYSLTAVQEKNSQGQFGTWKVQQVGYVQDEGLYNVIKAQYESIKDRDIKITREAGDDDVPDLTGSTTSEM